MVSRIKMLQLQVEEMLAEAEPDTVQGLVCFAVLHVIE
jgi:hypothetical protein